MIRQYHLQLAAKPTLPSSKSDSLAIFLNVVGNLVGAMSTIGSLRFLIGDESPETTTVITLLAIERMLNLISFNQDKVRKTVKDFCGSLHNFCGSFFKRKNPQPAIPAEKNESTASSWYCWRRR